MGHRFRRVVAVVVLVAWAAGASGLAAAQDGQLGPDGAGTCVAGHAGIGDGYFPTAGNGGYDVRHYDLDLELDVETSEILAATATIKALAVADLCSFNLDFEGLDIDGITVDGIGTNLLRRGKELTVTPERPISAGDAFTVEVRYHGTPIIRDELGDGPDRGQEPTGDATGVGGADPEEVNVFSGGWFVAEDEIFILGEPTGNRTWFPLNEHPADKATYTFRYTVPKPFLVVGNAVKVEEVDNGDTTTFVYASADPIANYLVTFHAGRLEIEELEGPGGLPITLSFAPGVPEDQRAVFRRMPDMLGWMEGVFGPYPFETAGAIVAGAEFYLALETQTIPVYGTYGDDPDADLPPAALAGIENIIVHELAHQWYGNFVSVQRWRDMWLSEGFATYAEALWIEESEGVEARDDLLRELYAASRTAATFTDPAQLADLTAADVLNAIQARGELRDQEAIDDFLDLLDAEDVTGLDDIPAVDALAALEESGVPADVFPGLPLLTGDPGAEQMFSNAGVYGRGGLTLHALRVEVGDAVFFEFLKEWGERFGDGNAATQDLVTLAEELSGEELSPLFDAWLFQVALPELEGISG